MIIGSPICGDSSGIPSLDAAMETLFIESFQGCVDNLNFPQCTGNNAFAFKSKAACAVS